jgi:DNA-nicking Smr family endonuclease
MAKLSELKSLLDKARRSATPRDRPGPARAPATGVERIAREPADVDMHEVFADVQPLGKRNRVAPTRAAPAATPAQRLADEAAALAASKYGVEPSPAHWAVGQEVEAEQTFVRKGLGSDVLERLRRGRWAVQGEIDLHRLNRSEARDALADFLLDARSSGWRCVRVIHGKGLGSPNREPVLKNSIRRWLTQRDEVLAYCEPPHHGGGGGAVLVLLKSPAGTTR